MSERIKPEPKVLEPTNTQDIISFERDRLLARVADPMEAELQSWQASWRKESLEHYLPLGWSFGLFNNEPKEAPALLGYFLAQPQLFIGGLTQTLWVEMISASDKEVMSELIELAYRVARDKHFQRVVFRIDEGADFSHSVLQLNQMGENLFELKTAKFL